MLGTSAPAPKREGGKEDARDWRTRTALPEDKGRSGGGSGGDGPWPCAERSKCLHGRIDRNHFLAALVSALLGGRSKAAHFLLPRLENDAAVVLGHTCLPRLLARPPSDGLCHLLCIFCALSESPRRRESFVHLSAGLLNALCMGALLLRLHVGQGGRREGLRFLCSLIGALRLGLGEVRGHHSPVHCLNGPSVAPGAACRHLRSRYFLQSRGRQQHGGLRSFPGGGGGDAGTFRSRPHLLNHGAGGRRRLLLVGRSSISGGAGFFEILLRAGGRARGLPHSLSLGLLELALQLRGLRGLPLGDVFVGGGGGRPRLDGLGLRARTRCQRVTLYDEEFRRVLRLHRGGGGTGVPNGGGGGGRGESGAGEGPASYHLLVGHGRDLVRLLDCLLD
mmetsp:Transcript_28785/g.91905  ORF Transcript_28785/g.91905 Transcript_28785/m.91905 type:complete len:392 (+) Transcript_28785:161-1336(+)